jgi:fructokinase
MTARETLVVGEALVDVVDGNPLPGGSAANVAVALGRLGQSVSLATQLCDDEPGRLVREHLESSRVAVRAEAGARTSVARAVVDSTGSASYEFDVEWNPDFDDLVSSHAVHVGSFSALTGSAVRDVLGRSTGTITYDINVRPQLMPANARRDVEALIERADLVKASEEDLAWLYPSMPADRAARALVDLGPRAVFLTRGASGAVLLTRDRAIAIPAVDVDVVDTIGAGDTFAAGLLHALDREGFLGGPLTAGEEVLVRAGRFAAWLAAQTAARQGADPPWDAIYEEVLELHPTQDTRAK